MYKTGCSGICINPHVYQLFTSIVATRLNRGWKLE